MITGILISNGCAHSPEKWAYASASMLLDAIRVDPNSPRYIELELKKDAIRPQIAVALLAHHDKVQTGERKILAEGQHDRLAADLDASEHTDVDAAADEVYKLTAPLLETSLLFAGGDVTSDPEETHGHLKRCIRERVEQDLRTNMHIERSWHSDRHPDNPHSIAFRAKFHSGQGGAI
jgi:hypothetical protein